MLRTFTAIAFVLGCRDSKPAPATPTPTTPPAGSAPAPATPSAPTASADAKPSLAGWDLPTGWRSEVIPFPLDFAPSLAHRGFEEIRFAPGMFDPAAPGYWSYAFIWRTDNDAVLDEAALGSELTTYFRGLIAAVDDKHRVTARDQIVVRAVRDGDRFKLTAHIFDAFKTAQPIDLTGWAERRACTTGALWIFVLAPAASGVRPQLDALGQSARC
jgi:hypothetical protein